MISVPNPNLGAQSYKNPEVKATACHGSASSPSSVVNNQVV